MVNFSPVVFTGLDLELTESAAHDRSVREDHKEQEVEFEEGRNESKHRVNLCNQISEFVPLLAQVVVVETYL